MPRKAKPKTRRSRSKYPALDPKLNLKMRQQQISDVAEYAHTLSEENKEWMNKFMSEYVNCDMDRVNFENNIHNTKELKQDCDRMNNSRKNDILTRAIASGNFVDWEEYKAMLMRDEESYVIDKIDEDSVFEVINDAYKANNKESNTGEGSEDL